MQVEDHPDHPEENGKKVRKRKKSLYNSILQQMEFYFSDANVRKDRFIGQRIKDSPYVELSVFLKFNKIAALTNKIEELATALEKSEMLQLSEDKSKVCRITPFKEKENEDECTIYVERLPDDTQHDWLREIFSSFGNIDYISLPRYKHNRRHKGFAFIEFSEPEAAQKALAYFESIGCKLPTQMPPNQLVSIVTFAADNVKNEDKTEEQSKEDINQNKDQSKDEDTKHEQIVENTNEGNKKKRKLSSDNEQSKVKKTKTGEEDTAEDGDMNEENKKKRKRKKNKKSGCDFTQIGLQVLSKREWKQLRNKYLNMQRLKMKSLKEHLYRKRHPEYEQPEVNTEENMESENADETEPRFKFVPGCIIRFIVPDTCTDVKKLKSDFRIQSGVEFVDVQKGKEMGYIRFSNSDSCQQFMNSALVKTMNVLEGEDETNYWNKIIKDRNDKLKKGPAKKQRGREKLLKKAEHELGKHIRFENI